MPGGKDGGLLKHPANAVIARSLAAFDLEDFLPTLIILNRRKARLELS